MTTSARRLVIGELRLTDTVPVDVPKVEQGISGSIFHLVSEMTENTSRRVVGAVVVSEIGVIGFNGQ